MSKIYQLAPLFSDAHGSLAEHLGWISDTLLKAIELAPPSLKVDIRIYVTGRAVTRGSSDDGESISSGSDSEKKEELANVLAHSSVSLFERRPDIGTILREEAEGTNGRMSVTGEYIFPHNSR